MIHITKTAKSKISGLDDSCIQPNAVDLKLDRVFTISNGIFTISEDGKEHRKGSKEVKGDDEWFYLEPGLYDVLTTSKVQIAEGEAGWVIQRSTLNRNGVHLYSGLYDSGYNGVLGCVLEVKRGPMKIKKGTRIGQFLLFKSDSIKSYDGDYGDNTKHDEKYL